MDDSKQKCHCKHGRIDHMIVQKKMTYLAYLERGIFLTRQLDYGMCKKCTCPKYEPPKLFRTKKEITYQVKPMNVLDDSEKRCKRCGTLFERHLDMNHPFQDKLT